MPEGKFQLTACGNLCTVVNRVVKLGKCQPHFFLRLHVKFLSREGKRIVIVDRPSGLNRNQYLLHPGIFLTQIVAVVGRDQRNTCFIRKHPQRRENLLLLRQTVVLYLDKKVIFPENLPVLERRFFRSGIIVHHQPPRNFARKTC